MADEAGARVQKAVESMIQDLDKSCLRRMQGDMHKCAARCCDDMTTTMEGVHRCIESCSEHLNRAQNQIQGELGNFHDRIQRCVMQCQDTVRDQVLPSTTDADAAKYKTQFDTCVVKCADTHIELVPQLLKRMKEMLKKA
ncbi:unnamed protein product [Ixodes pacificus]